MSVGWSRRTSRVKSRSTSGYSVGTLNSFTYVEAIALRG